MTWTVRKVGTGTKQYAYVEVTEGGALKCYAWRNHRLSAGAGNVPVAYYGPGMWVSAVEDES